MLVCLRSQSYAHADTIEAPGPQSKNDIIMITNDKNNNMVTAKFHWKKFIVSYNESCKVILDQNNTLKPEKALDK